jgi:cellulose synthase/poly-beta-1,6-N-acetylglucosamine synthase-like glycosyltransferase
LPQEVCAISAARIKFTSGVVDISGIAVWVTYTGVPNKRLQIAHALPNVHTRLVVLLDDHVFLKPGFLSSALLAFEDERVGLCGRTKTVCRNKSQRYWESFWNVMGALYLTHHNFEIRATNTMDGGVFVVSGCALVILAEIVQDPKFISEFINEQFFFHIFSPLNPDDDNFITRWVLRHPERYEIKVQCTNDATIETTLGQYPKFISQCLR